MAWNDKGGGPWGPPPGGNEPRNRPTGGNIAPDFEAMLRRGRAAGAPTLPPVPGTAGQADPNSPQRPGNRTISPDGNY